MFKDESRKVVSNTVHPARPAAAIAYSSPTTDAAAYTQASTRDSLARAAGARSTRDMDSVGRSDAVQGIPVPARDYLFEPFDAGLAVTGQPAVSLIADEKPAFPLTLPADGEAEEDYMVHQVETTGGLDCRSVADAAGARPKVA